MDTNLLF